MDNPVHPNNANYLRLHTERVKEYFDYKGWKGFGLQNDGFDGISVKAGEKYDFSAFMRNVNGGAKQVRVVLVEQLPGWPPKDPKLLAETIIDVKDNAWKKYEAVLTPDSTCQKASLQLLQETFKPVCSRTYALISSYVALVSAAVTSNSVMSRSMSICGADLILDNKQTVST